MNEKYNLKLILQDVLPYLITYSHIMEDRHYHEEEIQDLDEIISSIDYIIEDLEKSSGWKPIEIAPDHEELLVCEMLENGKFNYWCGTQIQKQWYVKFGKDCKPINTLTHWRPLPQPPENLYD